MFAGMLGGLGEYQLVWATVKAITNATRPVFLDGAVNLAWPTVATAVNAWWQVVVTQTLTLDFQTGWLVLVVLCWLGLIWLSLWGVVNIVATQANVKIKKEPWWTEQVKVVLVGAIYLAARVLVGLMATLLVLFSLLTNIDKWLGWPLLITGAVVLLPTILYVSLAARLIIVEVVAKKTSLVEALAESYVALRKNWLVALELALAILLITVSIVTVAMVVLMLTAVPVIMSAVLVANVGAVAVATILFVLGVALLLTILMVTTAFLATFQWTCWSVFYLEVAHQEFVGSKIIRIAKRFINNYHVWPRRK